MSTTTKAHKWENCIEMFTLQGSHELRYLLNFRRGCQAVAALQSFLSTQQTILLCTQGSPPQQTLQSSWGTEVDPAPKAPLEGQPLTFETQGKEMKAADTTADLGKKLRKPVKQGHCPRNKSLQDAPHPNPKSLVYFQDEILEQKGSLQNGIQMH